MTPTSFVTARARARASAGCRFRIVAATLVLAPALATSGCRQDMQDQPRYQPFERSAFFADGRAARPLPAGTVARGQLRADDHLHRGLVEGAPAATFPMEITAEIMARGRERYDIYCSPCHDRSGSGQGMIVQRGYPAPTSFHDERLRRAPPGYFFSAVTNGFGVMPSYAVQIPVADRWAIIAYVRALQLSQHAREADVPAALRADLDRAPAARGAHAIEESAH